MPDRKKILTMEVDSTGLAKATEYVLSLSKRRAGAYVCVSNVHMCMETFDSPEFHEVVNNAELVVADGRPIFWAQRLLGDKDAQQVRGQDLMNSLCQTGTGQKINIGLYGGSSPEGLERVKRKLEQNFPGILITYSYSPPFRALSEEEDSAVINAINTAQVNVMFVGIGCPKQERWMAAHKNQLNCVMLGVGAAFDFIAGNKNHAPRWMQTIGLEWLYRLLSEPKRLWRRYLIQNPRFVYHFSKQWLFRKQKD